MASFDYESNDNGNGASATAAAAAAAAEGGSRNKNHCITDFVDQGSVESSRYYCAHRTVCKILGGRDYDVPYSKSRALCSISVVFSANNRTSKASVSVILSALIHRARRTFRSETFPFHQSYHWNRPFDVFREVGCVSVLLINFSKFTSKDLINDLLANISKHIWQPKYEVLTTDEKSKLLEKYKMEAKQLEFLEDRVLTTIYNLLSSHYKSFSSVTLNDSEDLFSNITMFSFSTSVQVARTGKPG
ncbi:DNA-directed RNA polymerase V subunit 5C-like [Prosopis cineraria]|uniref:DNA-directed RNA polymerase V subunit 5C-like n=1 Tax=Prosopis cineraria TaxID=364024 RepID=UPI0024102A71|nr:DNA-directed RNA polymerase V subunit 5C-like [Prosopis cineraria]